MKGINSICSWQRLSLPTPLRMGTRATSTQLSDQRERAHATRWKDDFQNTVLNVEIFIRGLPNESLSEQLLITTSSRQKSRPENPERGI